VRHHRLLAGAILAVIAVACSSPALPTGVGWSVTAIHGGPGVVLTTGPLQDNHFVLTLGVAGPCGVGGNDPFFDGFTVSGTTVVANVKRTPIPSMGPNETCLITGDSVMEIVVDRRSLPESAERIILGGKACPPDDTTCTGLVAPLPRASPGT